MLLSGLPGMPSFKGRSFISINDFSRSELEEVLSEAARLKEALAKKEVTNTHSSKVIGAYQGLMLIPQCGATDEEGAG